MSTHRASFRIGLKNNVLLVSLFILRGGSVKKTDMGAALGWG